MITVGPCKLNYILLSLPLPFPVLSFLLFFMEVMRSLLNILCSPLLLLPLSLLRIVLIIWTWCRGVRGLYFLKHFLYASGFYLLPFHKLVLKIFCRNANYYLGKVQFHVVYFQKSYLWTGLVSRRKFNQFMVNVCMYPLPNNTNSVVLFGNGYIHFV